MVEKVSQEQQWPLYERTFQKDLFSRNGRSLHSAPQVLEPTWYKDVACGPLEVPKPTQDGSTSESRLWHG